MYEADFTAKYTSVESEVSYEVQSKSKVISLQHVNFPN